MSLYYSPEIVRLLMAERLDEARRAHRAPRGRSLPAVFGGRARLVAFARRVAGFRSSPAACSCS